MLPRLAATQSDHAADREADHGGADRQLPAMSADLAAPIGELGHSSAQGLHRVAQLGAVALDVGADLVRVATRGPGRAAADRLTGPAHVHVGGAHRPPASRVSLVRRTSSMARSGVGGAPARTERKANKPAPAATRN